MLLRWPTLGGTSVLALAAVLYMAGPGMAAGPHGGGGGHGGGGHGGGYAGGGHGGGYHGGSYHGGGYAGGHYGGYNGGHRGHYPVYSGYQSHGYYASGFYGSGLSFGLGYSPGYYSNPGYPGYPGYYGDYDIPRRWSVPDYYGSVAPQTGYQAFYPPAVVAESPAAQPDMSVELSVRVPGDAELWFDGMKTRRTGTVREFVSPPLTPGQSYTYEIRARWTEGGREVDQTRNIDVHAGERLSVDFLSSAPVGVPAIMPKAG